VRIHSTETSLRFEDVYASFGGLVEINALVFFVKRFELVDLEGATFR